MQKNTHIWKGVFLLAIFSILGFGLQGQVQSPSIISSVLASDGEDREDSEEDEDKEEDEDEKDSDEDEDSESEKRKSEKAKKLEEIRKESAKKDAERIKEAAKKAEEIRKETAKQKLELAKKLQKVENEDEDENEVEDESLDDNDADEEIGDDESSDDSDNRLEKAEKRYQKALDEIAKSEADIAKHQTNGKDVSLAQARLAQAKALADKAKQLLDLKEYAASYQASREAIKLADWARGKDIHSLNGSLNVIRKATQKIEQSAKKLAKLSALGGDGTNFQKALDQLKTDLKQAQDLIQAGSVIDGTALAERVEQDAKSLRKAIEAQLLALGAEDDDVAGDYKSTVTQTVSELLEVADIEGDSLGEKIRTVAKQQRDSAKSVEGLVDDVHSRSKVAEFILGPKYGSLSALQQEIDANKVRIQELTTLKSTVSDADIQEVIQDQIDALSQENAKLESFISGKETERGVFGWIFRLLQ